MTKYLPYVSKALAALIVCALALVAKGMLPAEVATWVQVATPFLVALGVYHAPENGPKPESKG